MKTLILFLEIIWFIIILFYLYLFFYRNTIETSMTFVWLWVHENYDYSANWFEEIHIKNKNWTTIHGIFLDNKEQKTIYYFHGNGWPLKYYTDNIKYLWNLGYNVMSYDYPGYGKSTWYPLEQEVYNYSQSFFEYMKKEKWIQSENIIVFWHSIGTWVGTDFVHKNNVEKLILISPLASRYDMSIEKYWFILQKIVFLKNSFDTYSKISHIKIPTLIIHGNADEVIPYSHWEKVFKNSISKNKYFITLENFWHNGIIENYWEELKPKFQDFLRNGILIEKNIISIKK